MSFRRRKRTHMEWRLDPDTREPIAKDVEVTESLYEWKASDGTVYRSPDPSVLQRRKDQDED